jgi:hypothetical protein
MFYLESPLYRPEFNLFSYADSWTFTVDLTQPLYFPMCTTGSFDLFRLHFTISFQGDYANLSRDGRFGRLELERILEKHPLLRNLFRKSPRARTGLPIN